MRESPGPPPRIARLKCCFSTRVHCSNQQFAAQQCRQPQHQQQQQHLPQQQRRQPQRQQQQQQPQQRQQRSSCSSYSIIGGRLISNCNSSAFRNPLHSKALVRVTRDTCVWGWIDSCRHRTENHPRAEVQIPSSAALRLLGGDPLPLRGTTTPDVYHYTPRLLLHRLLAPIPSARISRILLSRCVEQHAVVSTTKSSFNFLLLRSSPCWTFLQRPKASPHHHVRCGTQRRHRRLGINCFGRRPRLLFLVTPRTCRGDLGPEKQKFCADFDGLRLLLCSSAGLHHCGRTTRTSGERAG